MLSKEIYGDQSTKLVLHLRVELREMELESLERKNEEKLEESELGCCHVALHDTLSANGAQASTEVVWVAKSYSMLVQAVLGL